jgi:predicted dehydrogenase
MGQTGRVLKIVVEGTGQIVQDKYAPALKDQYDIAKNGGGSLDVTFIDQSEYWDTSTARPEDISTRKKFVSKLNGWATYLDKSIDRDAQLYQDLSCDVVIVATPDETHVMLVLGWLCRANSCKHIFIEKPIDSSLSSARTLQYYARRFPAVTLYPLDHYLARFTPLKDYLTIKGLLKEIGGRLTKMTFHLLEDRSKPNFGPIEGANRVRSLKHGMILDLFPHVLAIVRVFGRVETIEIKKLRVAQYTYEAADGGCKKTEIPKETFAHVDFTVAGFAENIIEVTTFLGKGVHGSSDLNIIGGDVKRLELVGANQKRLVIDLRSTERGGTGSVEIHDAKGRRVGSGPNLIDDPYYVLVEQIVDKFLWSSNVKLDFYLDLQTAKSSLSCIHELMTLVQNFLHTGREMTLYDIKTTGTGGERISRGPLLEEILECLVDVYEAVPVEALIDFYAGELKKKKDGTHQLPH